MHSQLCIDGPIAFHLNKFQDQSLACGAQLRCYSVRLPVLRQSLTGNDLTIVVDFCAAMRALHIFL